MWPVVKGPYKNQHTPRDYIDDDDAEDEGGHVDADHDEDDDLG